MGSGVNAYFFICFIPQICTCIYFGFVSHYDQWPRVKLVHLQESSKIVHTIWYRLTDFHITYENMWNITFTRYNFFGSRKFAPKKKPLRKLPMWEIAPVGKIKGIKIFPVYKYKYHYKSPNTIFRIIISGVSSYIYGMR